MSHPPPHQTPLELPPSSCDFTKIEKDSKEEAGQVAGEASYRKSSRIASEGGGELGRRK